jgi:hypothetical protein
VGVCVCVGFVMYGFVYVWDLYYGCACICGVFNVWVSVCVGFVMCGCVYVWDL